jgi:hypothetical protein
VHGAGDADAAPAVRATDRSVARGDRVPPPDDVPAPDVRPTRPAYRVVPVTDAGSVTGSVVFDGPAPTDSTYTPAEADRRACGATVADRTLDLDRAAAGATGAGVRGAVVWLEGVAAGKPLPGARRYELALDGCRLAPAHLAVSAGGTLNVHGVDALASRLRFTRLAAPGAPEAGRVLLRTSMTSAGQVVPDERVLAEAGAVDVREDTAAGPAARPWLRAWVLAFDQPYFAATGPGGAFALADVPPGTYRLVAWHARLGRAAAPVTVAAGQAAAVTLRFGAAGAAGPVPVQAAGR